MPPLRAIVAERGPAPKRLRKLIDTLIAVKRRRATGDPELFTAYGTLALDAPYPDACDLDGLRAEALAARADGFDGKAAIDPDQVAVINEVFGG